MDTHCCRLRMDYYNSNLIPQWKNSLLMVALKNARLYQMKLDGTFKTALLKPMSISQTIMEG